MVVEISVAAVEEVETSDELADESRFSRRDSWTLIGGCSWPTEN